MVDNINHLVTETIPSIQQNRKNKKKKNNNGKKPTTGWLPTFTFKASTNTTGLPHNLTRKHKTFLPNELKPPNVKFPVLSSLITWFTQQKDEKSHFIVQVFKDIKSDFTKRGSELYEKRHAIIKHLSNSIEQDKLLQDNMNRFSEALGPLEGEEMLPAERRISRVKHSQEVTPLLAAFKETGQACLAALPVLSDAIDSRYKPSTSVKDRVSDLLSQLEDGIQHNSSELPTNLNYHKKAFARTVQGATLISRILMGIPFAFVSGNARDALASNFAHNLSEIIHPTELAEDYFDAALGVLTIVGAGFDVVGAKAVLKSAVDIGKTVASIKGVVEVIPARVVPKGRPSTQAGLVIEGEVVELPKLPKAISDNPEFIHSVQTIKEGAQAATAAKFVLKSNEVELVAANKVIATSKVPAEQIAATKIRDGIFAARQQQLLPYEQKITAAMRVIAPSAKPRKTLGPTGGPTRDFSTFTKKPVVSSKPGTRSVSTETVEVRAAQLKLEAEKQVTKWTKKSDSPDKKQALEWNKPTYGLTASGKIVLPSGFKNATPTLQEQLATILSHHVHPIGQEIISHRIIVSVYKLYEKYPNITSYQQGLRYLSQEKRFLGKMKKNSTIEELHTAATSELAKLKAQATPTTQAGKKKLTADISRKENEVEILNRVQNKKQQAGTLSTDGFALADLVSDSLDLYIYRSKHKFLPTSLVKTYGDKVPKRKSWQELLGLTEEQAEMARSILDTVEVFRKAVRAGIKSGIDTPATLWATSRKFIDGLHEIDHFFEITLIWEALLKKGINPFDITNPINIAIKQLLETDIAPIINKLDNYWPILKSLNTIKSDIYYILVQNSTLTTPEQIYTVLKNRLNLTTLEEFRTFLTDGDKLKVAASVIEDIKALKSTTRTAEVNAFIDTLVNVLETLQKQLTAIAHADFERLMREGIKGKPGTEQFGGPTAGLVPKANWLKAMKQSGGNSDDNVYNNHADLDNFTCEVLFEVLSENPLAKAPVTLSKSMWGQITLKNGVAGSAYIPFNIVSESTQDTYRHIFDTMIEAYEDIKLDILEVTIESLSNPDTQNDIDNSPEAMTPQSVGVVVPSTCPPYNEEDAVEVKESPLYKNVNSMESYRKLTNFVSGGNGNRCYMNSVLQMCFSILEFRDFFITVPTRNDRWKDGLTASALENVHKLLFAMHSLFLHMGSTMRTELDIERTFFCINNVPPVYDIYNVLLYPNFHRNRQEDAQEFMYKILEILLNNQSDIANTFEVELTTTMGRTNHEKYNAIPEELRVTKTASYSKKESMLLLNIIGNDITIQELLEGNYRINNNNLSENKNELEYTKAAPYIKGSATQYIELTITPTTQYLFISLVRYKNRFTKDSSIIKFTPEININGAIFKIKGCIPHMTIGGTDNLHSGHYYYYLIQKVSTLYIIHKIEDSNPVTVVKFNKFKSDIETNGYIFLYERINGASQPLPASSAMYQPLPASPVSLDNSVSPISLANAASPIGANHILNKKSSPKHANQSNYQRRQNEYQTRQIQNGSVMLKPSINSSGKIVQVREDINKIYARQYPSLDPSYYPRVHLFTPKEEEFTAKILPHISPKEGLSKLFQQTPFYRNLAVKNLKNLMYYIYVFKYLKDVSKTGIVFPSFDKVNILSKLKVEFRVYNDVLTQWHRLIYTEKRSELIPQHIEDLLTRINYLNSYLNSGNMTVEAFETLKSKESHYKHMAPKEQDTLRKGLFSGGGSRHDGRKYNTRRYKRYLRRSRKAHTYK